METMDLKISASEMPYGVFQRFLNYFRAKIKADVANTEAIVKKCFFSQNITNIVNLSLVNEGKLRGTKYGKSP